jgi:predicted TIM-barrel fold metal-dependent hydrolase
MSAIRRDFFPTDLEKEIRGIGIDNVISVQARQTVNETRWLLELAAENSFIKGVVGWVSLTSTEVKDDLGLLANRPVPWSRQVAELAGMENVFCRVSGLVKDADFQDWTQG